MHILSLVRFFILTLYFQNAFAANMDLRYLYNTNSFEIKVEKVGKASSGKLHLRQFPLREGNISLDIIVPPEHGIALTLQHLQLAENCETHVELRSKTSYLRFCRSTFAKNIDVDSVVFLDSVVNLNIYKGPGSSSPELDIGYSTMSTEACSAKTHFRCANGFCVWKDFRCNGYNNCGDESDELHNNTRDRCAVEEVFKDSRTTVLTAIVILLPIIMFIICCFVAWGTRNKEQAILSEGHSA